MTPGALVITFPTGWDTARRREFMAAVAEGIPPARWASRMAESGRTVEIAVSADERRVILARQSDAPGAGTSLGLRARADGMSVTPPLARPTIAVFSLARATWDPTLVYPSVDIPRSGPAMASSRHVVPLVRATRPARDRDAGQDRLPRLVLASAGAGAAIARARDRTLPPVRRPVPPLRVLRRRSSGRPAAARQSPRAVPRS